VPKLFNILEDLLEWIVLADGVPHIMHYLDDFLILGPSMSPTCQHNLDTIMRICHILGVQLALKKVEGPSTTLPFLGIVLDTTAMEARLPRDKLEQMCNLVSTWLKKKKATKREILSLVALLQHVTKVVQCGRPFLNRMYVTAAKVRELDFYTRLNRDFCSDHHWWNTFLVSWNSFSLLRSTTIAPQFYIRTDASGSWGCGAYFQGQWFHLPCDKSWLSPNIMAKELVPIILSAAVWGLQLQGSQVCYQCDNSSVVAALSKGSTQDTVVMQLLRCLWFFYCIL